MSAFKNVSGHTLRFRKDGPQGKVTEVPPGKTFTLDDDLDYLVGSQIGVDQVKKLDLDGDQDPPQVDVDTTGNPQKVVEAIAAQIMANNATNAIGALQSPVPVEKAEEARAVFALVAEKDPRATVKKAAQDALAALNPAE